MDGRRCFQIAEHPLSEEEIRQRFACLFVEGYEAFREDSTYYLSMMEHGTILTYRRVMRDLELELADRKPRKGETRTKMLKRVASERGISVPTTTTIRSKVKDRPSQVV